MDVLVGIICSIMASYISGTDELYQLLFGDRYFLTGTDWPDQTGKNDYEVQEGCIPAFFEPISESEAICILVCLTSLICVRCPISEQEMISELLHLEAVAISWNPVIVGYGFLQHEKLTGRALTVHATTLI